MALKADRHELDVDISFFMDATATRGGCVSIVAPGGSGAAMDQANAKVNYVVAANDVVPVGILLNDVVDLDLTRQHINHHKDEVQKGGKVSILKKGWVVTNMITGTPTMGAAAYLDDLTAGNITIKASLDSGEYQNIGRFMSILDEDSYCKVEVNLPAAKDDTGSLE
jgi:hypothetical protein